jgi:hypothetical protein
LATPATTITRLRPIRRKLRFETPRRGEGEPPEKPQRQFPALWTRGDIAGLKGLSAAHSFKEHHRQCQHPGGNLRGDDQGEHSQEKPDGNDCGFELRWFPRQVVVDVVGSDQQPVDASTCSQKGHRDQQEPYDRGCREVDECHRPPIGVEQGVQPGHVPVFEGTETDDHELAGLGEENAQGNGGYHHQRCHAEWVEQKRHDRLIGYDAGRRAPQEELPQQTDSGRDDDDGQDSREKIGENQLRPGAAKVPKCVNKERLWRCAQNIPPGSER